MFSAVLHPHSSSLKGMKTPSRSLWERWEVGGTYTRVVWDKTLAALASPGQVLLTLSQLHSQGQVMYQSSVPHGHPTWGQHWNNQVCLGRGAAPQRDKTCSWLSFFKAKGHISWFEWYSAHLLASNRLKTQWPHHNVVMFICFLSNGCSYKGCWQMGPELMHLVGQEINISEKQYFFGLFWDLGVAGHSVCWLSLSSRNVHVFCQSTLLVTGKVLPWTGKPFRANKCINSMQSILYLIHTTS